jgi:hypothetical protein
MHVPTVVRQGRRCYRGHRTHCWHQLTPQQPAVRELTCAAAAGGAGGLACALQGVAAPDDVRRRLGGHAGSTRCPTPTLAISSLTHARRPPRARPRVWPNPMSCMRMGITPAVDEFRVHVARPRAQALLVWSHLPVRRLLSSLRTRALGAGGLIVPKDSLVRKNMHKGLYINFKLK